MIKKAHIMSFYSWNNQLNIRETDYLEESEIKNNKKIVEGIKVSESITDSDTVFFHSSSGIPRYKFGKYCEGKKLKRVINIDNATCYVVNMGLLRATVDLSKHCSMDTYYILTGAEVKGYMGVKVNPMPKDDDTILVNDYTYKQMLGKLPVPPISSLNSVRIGLYYGYNSANVTKAIKGAEDLEKIVNRGVKIIDDEFLNREISKGSLVIGDDNYDEFCQMLSSNNKETITLAMELVANADYKQSQFHISLLLNRFHNTINLYIKQKTVNLKNFFEFFKNIYWQSPRQTFLPSLRKALMKEGNLTQEREDTIRKEMLAYANDTIRSCGIKVEAVKFIDES
jgi:hypothetical protein